MGGATARSSRQGCTVAKLTAAYPGYVLGLFKEEANQRSCSDKHTTCNSQHAMTHPSLAPPLPHVASAASFLEFYNQWRPLVQQLLNLANIQVSLSA